MPAELSMERDRAKRDARVLTLVGSGHFCSHFYGIALPPLFPLMQADLGISYAALGSLLGASNLAAALFQTPVGFLVDRFGAWRLLVLGLGVMSGAIAALSLASGYAAMIVLMVCVGLGNSVFHPADYAILSARIGASRIGRAFSLHTFAGNLGWAAAPTTLLFLTALWGWRGALLTIGLCGLALALAMGFQARVLHFDPDDAPGPATQPAPSPDRSQAATSGLSLLLSPQMLLFFLFMALAAIGSSGLRDFAVTVLVQEHGAPLAMANAALTALLIAGAAGVLLGGQVADRTQRHDLIMIVGFLAAAALLILIQFGGLSIVALMVAMGLIGLAQGATRPSRDMMIRAAAPKGTAGKVFGFVTTGMNVGGIAAPVVFGLLIDLGSGGLVFVLAAIALVLALGTVLFAIRR